MVRSSRRTGVLVLATLAIVTLFFATLRDGTLAERSISVTGDGGNGAPFQTVRLPAVSDSTLDSFYTSRNFGSTSMLRLGAGDVTAPLLKFDVSAIADRGGVAVSRATLNVYMLAQSGGGAVLVSACALKRPWAEEEATWLRANEAELWEVPGAAGTLDRGQDCPPPVRLSSVGRWLALDVTEPVFAWLNGTAPNNGLILETRSGATVEFRLPSREYADSSLRPILEIVFAPLPTPTPTATPLPAVGIAKTGPRGPLQVGSYYTITYDIVVNNPGFDPLSGVVVTDILPLGTEFLTASEGGVYDGENPDQQFVSWRVGSLTSGQVVTLNLELGLPTWVKNDGTIVNMARTVCDECSQVSEAYWEVPVVVPSATVEPSPEPTATATLSPTPTSTPTSHYLYLGTVFKAAGHP